MRCETRFQPDDDETWLARRALAGIEHLVTDTHVVGEGQAEADALRDARYLIQPEGQWLTHERLDRVIGASLPLYRERLAAEADRWREDDDASDLVVMREAQVRLVDELIDGLTTAWADLRSLLYREGRA